MYILNIADAYSHFKKPLQIVYIYIRFEEGLKWMKDKLERDLKFLKEIEKELDIRDIIRECEKVYECFLHLLG